MPSISFSTKQLSNVVILIFLVSLLSACSAVAVLRDASTVQSTREAQLPGLLEKFSKARYWGKSHDINKFLLPEDKRAFMTEVKQRSRKEKVVELEYENLEFNEDATEAEVDMRVRFFNKPTSYVKTRIERHFWKYHIMDGGWRFSESKILQEDGSLTTFDPSNPSATLGAT